MGLLAVQVYSPASLRCAGLTTRESPETVILASGLMAAPPLPHWTAISVPAVHVHLRDTFLPSAATVRSNRPIPATASVGGGRRDTHKKNQLLNMLSNMKLHLGCIVIVVL